MYDCSAKFVGNKVIYAHILVYQLHGKRAILKPNVISGFRHSVNEIYSLLGFVEA
jgi:hypothetical protein